MRMIHFIDPQGTEKNHNWHAQIRETDAPRLVGRSNTVWARFKRWLLVFIHRKRL